jgi:hypothetical protein
MYVTIALLLMQAPPLFYPGILLWLGFTIFSHLRWRKTDMKARKGIVVLAVGILSFILWALAVLGGTLAL